MTTNIAKTGRPSRAGMYFSAGVAAIVGSCHLAHQLTIEQSQKNILLNQGATAIVTGGDPCEVKTVRGDTLARVLLGVNARGDFLPLNQPETTGADLQLAQLIRNNKIDPNAAVDTIAAQLSPLENRSFKDLLNWYDRFVLWGECSYSVKIGQQTKSLPRSFPIVDTGVSRDAVLNELKKLPATSEPTPPCRPYLPYFIYNQCVSAISGPNTGRTSDGKFFSSMNIGDTADLRLLNSFQFGFSGLTCVYYPNLKENDDSVEHEMERKFIESRFIQPRFLNYACGLRGEIVGAKKDEIKVRISSPPQADPCETEMILAYKNETGEQKELTRIKIQTVRP